MTNLNSQFIGLVLIVNTYNHTYSYYIILYTMCLLELSYYKKVIII